VNNFFKSTECREFQLAQQCLIAELEDAVADAKILAGLEHVSSEAGQGPNVDAGPFVSEAHAPGDAEEPGSGDFAGNGKTILLVDDEASIRAVVGRVLSINGYRVIQADSGMDGLARLRECSGEVELVLADLVMPVMAGHEFVRAVHVLKPSLKIITLSGLGTCVQRFTDLGPMVSMHLAKPFGSDDLLHAVRQVLGKPATPCP
jgi:CheY-like chemotaxis protein